jgi:2-polyprenyl-3-methyl-5-hydroxy-6-metoxy-1,4-benzoquinol methylase
MNPLVREKLKTFERLTDPSNERNIYTHPNPLARDIFWQRLELLLCGMNQHVPRPRRILDFGGGSGGFLKGLALSFPDSIVDVIDLDPDDAERVRDFNNLSNVRIFRGNIDSWQPDHHYDVVVATDVLEHFTNLKMPVDAIRRFMTEDGHLCISVPTENLLYLGGRVVLNKKKPLDHFHSASTILCHLNNNHFRTIWKLFAPRYFLIPLPLFQLAILRLE